jgi:hypothetical protein
MQGPFVTSLTALDGLQDETQMCGTPAPATITVTVGDVERLRKRTKRVRSGKYEDIRSWGKDKGVGAR